MIDDDSTAVRAAGFDVWGAHGTTTDLYRKGAYTGSNFEALWLRRDETPCWIASRGGHAGFTKTNQPLIEWTGPGYDSLTAAFVAAELCDWGRA